MKTPETISTAAVTVQDMSTGNTEVKDLHPGLVSIVVKYPKDYSGPRNLIEGKVYPVSKETSELLIEKGIASLSESVKEELGEIIETKTQESEVVEVKKETTNSKSKNLNK